jgi:hypothetical protein
MFWILSVVFILFGIFGIMTPTLIDRIISFIIGIPLLIIAIYLTRRWHKGL